MKKNRAITIVVLTAIAFIFLLIYKQTWLTQLLYEQQRLIITRAQLKADHEDLARHLYQLKDPDHVYHYAITTLGLQKMALSQANVLKQELIP